MPAGGLKGKTWGPSTCHQRERGHLPLVSSQAPRPGGNWSKSAPNLDKPRPILSRPPNDIGNISSDNKSLGYKGDNLPTSTLQHFKNKITALNLSELRPFRSSCRNNSLPTNNASFPKNPALINQSRLSRSIGSITESHYDTVFSTDSFLIAQGMSNNNLVDFGKGYIGVTDDKEKLLED